MGATVGTRLMTWWKGQLVGEDQFGNKYYTEKSGGGRRWVIYEGAPEASKVPPEWHAWLHRTVDEPPLGERPPIPWERQHQENLTGTAAAHRPAGSVLAEGRRPKATGDYEAWTPE
ncbi:MAG: NADH:ubiquinone oxidoreductase subunit NDUFA12 [Alphaproteobacteria bacterium]|jgi:NADH:ubiquinone oxidoreductase subunit|nr:NADH:ubiquinone oxidoreductase subunit NDUFA12 [Alphaproteobacteria bacterium]